MNYKVEKEKWIKKTERLQHWVTEVLPDSSQLKPLAELLADLAEDYYTIIVLGEFKHGKSTFVNALLGQDIMPRDVTPTTATINAVFYSQKPEVQIVKHNGDLEKKGLSSVVLSKYTASSELNTEEIKYIKLFMDSPLLQDRVVLIDTPGLNDLNQQRSEITYQFLPRADVVVFITSMDGAFKYTEEKFIKNVLLKNGFDRMIVAANFLDRIDEEEVDETVEFMEQRAQKIFGEPVRVFPISSKEALEAKMTSDEDLLVYSGLKEIEKEIRERIESGNRSQEKLSRFKMRLQLISRDLQAETDLAERLSDETIEQLEEQVRAVEAWLSNQDPLRNQLQDYIFNCEAEIQFIVRKSLHYFGNRLKEDIENRILLFHGADIKALVESQLPVLIRSQFNQWVDQYNDHIHELLYKLELEVSQGLSNAFKQTIKIKAFQGDVLRFTESVRALQTQTGNANIKAGLLMGGASSIALLLGGSFFIPLVGMAGLPFLSQKIAEKQMENVKPDLIEAVDQQINELLFQFQGKLDRYIKAAVQDINDQAIDAFSRKLYSIQSMIEEEISEKKQEASHLSSYKTSLVEMKQFIANELFQGESR